MHVSKNFAVKTIADITQPIVAGEPGVQLIVPQECSRIVIENGDAANSIGFQTDKEDGGTIKTIPATLELDISARSSGAAVFQRGEVVGYLVKGSGTGPVTITFTR